MNSLKNKILIVGGYGNVGTVIVKITANMFPGKIIIAGRNKEKAQQLIKDLNIQASAVRIDLGAREFNEINFEEIHTAICCIEVLQTDDFILSCIKHHVNYTELATSYKAYQRLINYRNDVEMSGMCIIPGVGLMPGLSGVFVQNAISRFKQIQKTESFVLLGLGEDHGLDSIRWMTEYADKTFYAKTVEGEKQVDSLTDPLNEKLLNENSPRRFYRFNFGDQHIISKTMEVNSAETRLAFDSKFVTWLLVVIKKLGLLTKLGKINPRIIKKWLAGFPFASERFAVQTHCYTQDKNEIIYLAAGFSEARATGIIAAYAVSCLYQSGKTGIKRFEELIQFDDFVQYLKIHEINIEIKNY
jgi:saccharopine dehydrogenase-like NADP-dependent oxidoreductase